MNQALPALAPRFTPEEVATHYGWSSREIRKLARQIGACRVVGNKMILTKEDVDAILEASRWRSSSSTVAATGKSRARSKGSDTEKALELLRETERRRSAI